jgi:hypothetical protein
MIRDFEDLLVLAHSMDEPQRLLVLLAKAETQTSAEGDLQGGVLTPVICVDKAPGEIKDFRSLVAEADGVTRDWDMMLVASMGGSDGRAPSSEDAQPHLDRIANDILTGQDLTRYAIFDRNENLIVVEPRHGLPGIAV